MGFGKCLIVRITKLHHEAEHAFDSELMPALDPRPPRQHPCLYQGSTPLPTLHRAPHSYQSLDAPTYEASLVWVGLRPAVACARPIVPAEGMAVMVLPAGLNGRACALRSCHLAALRARRAQSLEVMVETGCWQGGSTAKWSVACRLLGYRLHVYDSFQGVEPRTTVEGRYDFTGQYAASLDVVRAHVARYGDLTVCTFHPGWFNDTMHPDTMPRPVRLVYIDCDLVKGTKEVLRAVVPVLSSDGVVASQDGQIPVVAELLAAPETWHDLGVRVRGTRRSRHLLVFTREESIRVTMIECP